MFRKILFLFLATPLLLAALSTHVSFPLLLLMVSLLLIALTTPSTRDEIE